MNKETIFLDEKGYENLLAEIAALELELVTVLSGGAETKGLEYTTTRAEIENRRTIIVSKLNYLYYRRDNCEIIKQEQFSGDDTERFLIGDIADITINMNGLGRGMTVMLVSDNTTRVDGVSNITLNSPMGKAIYGATVGTKGCYSANGQTCGFEVLKIAKKEREEGLQQ